MTKDGGYLLPEEIDPQRIQFCIEIPDDLNHIIAFWGALTELTYWWNWQRDDAHTAAQVIRVWQDVIDKAHASFENGDCESPVLCQEYSPKSARLIWFPENPFTPDPEPPNPWIFHPWTVVDASILGTIIGDWGLGYKVGDVFTDLTKIPQFSSDHPLDIWEDYPHFRLENLHGSGTVKIKLLNIPLGGRALIRKDDETVTIFNYHTVELNKDAIALPAETQVPIIVEVEFPIEGEHSLDVAFIPAIDDALPFVYYGGGFRGFELCGFGREGCQQMSEECCDELSTNQQRGNELLGKIYDLIKNGAYLNWVSNDLPADFRVDCSPSDFDKDDGETDGDVLADRAAALCLVVARYVLSVMYKLGYEARMTNGQKHDLLEFMDIDAPPDFYPQLKHDLVRSFSLDNLDLILASETAFDHVVCTWMAGLEGKSNTFAQFANSLVLNDIGTYPDTAEFLLTEWVVEFNTKRINYNTFAHELETAYADVQAGDTYTCPCEDAPVDTPLALIDPATPEFHDTVITPLGGNLYRIQQPREFPSGHWSVNLQTTTCQKLNFITGSGTAVNHWYDRGSDCTTIVADGAGGFAGETYQLGLDCLSALDITFEIVLA